MTVGNRHLSLLFLVGMVLAGPVIGEVLKDPDAWYREDYAPLWADNPGANVARLKTFYADEVVTHELGGAITREARQAWLVEPMQGWLADGWLAAELIAVRTQRINESTAAFTAQWRDRYVGDETEMTCGWYLADAIDGQWTFTEYADVDCEEQGFE